jgi:hypothetical protein
VVKESSGFRNRGHYKTAIYFRCGGIDPYPRLETSASQATHMVVTHSEPGSGLSSKDDEVRLHRSWG